MTNKKKILIIDDDVTSLEVIGFLFEKHGYDVHLHTSGDFIVEKIITTNPDIILLDIMMPGLSGTEVLKMVRKDLDWDKPIVVFTALDQTEIEDLAISLGANAVLCKPVSTDRLMEVVRGFQIV